MQSHRPRSSTPPARPSVANLVAQRDAIEAQLRQAEALELAEERRRDRADQRSLLVAASPSPRKKRPRAHSSALDVGLNLNNGASTSARTARISALGSLVPLTGRTQTLSKSSSSTRVAEPFTESWSSSRPLSGLLQGLGSLHKRKADNDDRKHNRSFRSSAFGLPTTTVDHRNAGASSSQPSTASLELEYTLGTAELASTSTSRSRQLGLAKPRYGPSADRDDSSGGPRDLERLPKLRPERGESSGAHMSRHQAAPESPSPSNGTTNEDSEADDLDIVDAPRGSPKRTRDGMVIEKLSLGPLLHPSIPGDPTYEAIEPYSRIRLREGSRVISHEQMQLHFSDRYHLSPSLLYSCARQIPGTDEIDIDLDADFIVVGVLAWKGPIKVTNPNAKDQSKERKNLRFTLVDLSTPAASSSGHGVLSVMLFEAERVDDRVEADGYRLPRFKGGSGGAYEKFWKESAGAVVAILNPRILKQREVPGKINVLTLAPQNADSMMVIGRAQDLRSCQARRADGSACEDWCDARINKYCEYHVNRAVKGTGVRRAETANVTSSMSTSSTFDHAKFDRQFKPGGPKRTSGKAAPYDPVRKVGLRPRDNMSVNEGLKTYVMTSGSTKGFALPSGRTGQSQTPAELRAAAIVSGNGTGGYIRGVRDGPTLVEVQRQRARKEAEAVAKELELRLLMNRDEGKTVGGEYLQLARESGDGNLIDKPSRQRHGSDEDQSRSASELRGARRKRGGSRSDSDGPASDGDGTGTTRRRDGARKFSKRRAFSTTAVRLIGYDPSNHGVNDVNDEESRTDKEKDIEALSSLSRDRMNTKKDASVSGSTRKPKGRSFGDRRPAQLQTDAVEDEDDLVIEGRPASPVFVATK